MLSSLAGSTQSPPPQLDPRPDARVPELRLVSRLRPTPETITPPALPQAAPPVARPTTDTTTLPITRGTFELLFAAQERAARDVELRRIGTQAANEAFADALRQIDPDTTGDELTLRNGVVSLRLRSEADLRLARDLYERYQASRSVGATPEEIMELERRFARIAGWPPLPPVTVEKAQGGALRGIASAIMAIEERIGSATTGR